MQLTDRQARHLMIAIGYVGAGSRTAWPHAKLVRSLNELPAIVAVQAVGTPKDPQDLALRDAVLAAVRRGEDVEVVENKVAEEKPFTEEEEDVKKQHEENGNAAVAEAPAAEVRAGRTKKPKGEKVAVDKFGARIWRTKNGEQVRTDKSLIHECVTRRHKTSETIAAEVGLPKFRIESRLGKCRKNFPDLIDCDERGWYLK